MGKTFKITNDHLRWIENRVRSEYRRKIARPVTTRAKLREILKTLIQKQNGQCAWSGVRLYFDVKHSGSSKKRSSGTHPLYASLEHKIPSDAQEGNGYEIVCAKLNDLKGALPFQCFKALQKTEAWKELMKKWKALSNKKAPSPKEFTTLLKNFDDKDTRDSSA